MLRFGRVQLLNRSYIPRFAMIGAGLALGSELYPSLCYDRRGSSFGIGAISLALLQSGRVQLLNRSYIPRFTTFRAGLALGSELYHSLCYDPRGSGFGIVVISLALLRSGRVRLWDRSYIPRFATIGADPASGSELYPSLYYVSRGSSFWIGAISYTLRLCRAVLLWHRSNNAPFATPRSASPSQSH
ncbi:hypothetical protein BJ095_10937 [Ureibacillus chungkukjangi]|uniref:Uncharacterized protein n=1 Tax=Ureibacillus chungkukjangi TaxID=1202712 RepID=A0A318TRA0_9BACL|nr:hypothetical protein BJ095_10937 [Ureibacillus chungkukjangi]